MFDESVRTKSDRMELVQLISHGISKGVIVPLERTIFDINSIEKGFRYMTSGKHIGKVVIKIRDEESDRYAIIKWLSVQAILCTIFKPNKCYIIIGGLGGFGLELLQWMVEKGARKLVVNARNGLNNNFKKYSINRIQNSRVEVVINNHDLSNVIQAQYMMKHAASMGEVAGIFNVAMVLNDALFETQSAESFYRVCEPKVNVTLNMDEISRKMCQNLDFFVVFSSVASGRGNAGQTNYSFANSVMERICEKRRNDGLPGLAIQWGAIGDVGVVAERMGGNDREIAGTLPQRLRSCLQVLDQFLQSNQSIVSCHVKAVHKDIAHSEKKFDLITNICNILGIKDQSRLNSNSTLADIGMDSLMATEVKQIIDKEGQELQNKELKNITVGELIEMS